MLKRIGLIVIMVAILVSVNQTSVFADGPEEDNPGGGEAALDLFLYEIMRAVSSSGCVYETKGDFPHLSRGDVSAHGWWLRQS